MFGSRLKGLRESREITQQELANILDVSVGTIGMYEIDKRRPNNINQKKLADYFNVSLDYLYGITDDPTPIKGKEQNTTCAIDSWDDFLANLPEDQAMHFQDIKYSDEDKQTIMEEAEKAKQKKQKKVNRLLKYTDEVIDDALIYAAFNAEMRKKTIEED